MKRHLTAAAFALAAAAVMANGSVSARAADDEGITLRGWVVKGDGGYVLLPLAEDGTAATAPAPAATSGSATVQDPDVASGAPIGTMRVLYWLDDDDEVDDHAGQRVEIVGKLEDDIDRGEISVEREDNGLVEVEFKREGKTISVKLPYLPASIGTAGSVTDREKDYEFAVRKVDVKSVRMLASVCQ